jgi:MYXO-CTERM domain-containing protein
VEVFKRWMSLALLLLAVGLVTPARAQNTGDQGMATTNDDDDGFDDWGLLGLLGLAGLLGRGRKDRAVVDTRRV